MGVHKQCKGTTQGLPREMTHRLCGSLNSACLGTCLPLSPGTRYPACSPRRLVNVQRGMMRGCKCTTLSVN
jgi:hypothetical protein